MNRHICDLTADAPPLRGLPLHRANFIAALDAMGPNDRVAELIRYINGMKQLERDVIHANTRK